jgi:type IV fimbrial biogenesis protein FimT
MLPPPQTAARGFTLIELMVTLGIGAILLAIGAPSFVDTVKAYRLDAAHSAMRDALLLARDTARNESIAVSVCTSTTGATCTASSWKQGFIVFRDAGTAGTVDGADSILMWQKDAGSAVSIAAAVKSSGVAYARNYVQFGDDGKLDPYYALEFSSCTAGQFPFKINVQRGGFISTMRGSVKCP